MILLHILTKDEEQANAISEYLIEHKLIFEAVIFEKVIARDLNPAGELISNQKVLVMGKTKSLLFNHIDEKIRENFSEHMPSLYSVPIVNMDWEQSNDLIQSTAKV